VVSGNTKHENEVIDLPSGDNNTPLGGKILLAR
jgi:hypothetical protein